MTSRIGLAGGRCQDGQRCRTQQAREPGQSSDRARPDPVITPPGHLRRTINCGSRVPRKEPPPPAATPKKPSPPPLLHRINPNRTPARYYKTPCDTSHRHPPEQSSNHSIPSSKPTAQHPRSRLPTNPRVSTTTQSCRPASMSAHQAIRRPIWASATLRSGNDLGPPLAKRQLFRLRAGVRPTTCAGEVAMSSKQPNSVKTRTTAAVKVRN